MKKLQLFFLAVIVIGGALLAYQVFFRKPAPHLQTTTVAKKNIAQTISASGKIKSKKQAALRFQTPGKLAWVGVGEGDTVFAGQTIAKLDSVQLEKELKKELNNFQTQITKQDDIRATYRDQVLTDSISRILTREQLEVDQAVLDVEIKDLAIKLSNLTTPISGIVTQVDTPFVGVNISSGTTYVVSDPQSLVFNTNVDETDISRVKPGQKATVSLDAYGDKTFDGKVIKVGFVAVTTSGGGTAFPVEVSIPKNTQDQMFKLDMNGSVDIVVQEKENSLVIPNEALVASQVWVLENGTPRMVTVQTGIQTDTETEILSGLKDGQTIILSPPQNLQSNRRGPILRFLRPGRD